MIMDSKVGFLRSGNRLLMVSHVLHVSDMCPTGIRHVFLHIKLVKLSPKMACRLIFNPIIPPETHNGTTGKVQWTPHATTMLMLSVIGHKRPRICFKWVLGPSEIIKIKLEKGF